MRPLGPRTERQYKRILVRAFGDAGGDFPALASLRVEVKAWPNSQKVLIRAALARRYKELGIDPDGLKDAFKAIPISWEVKRVTKIPSEEEILAYEIAAKALPPNRRGLALLPLAMGFRSEEVLSLERKAVERALKTGELIAIRKGGEEQALPCKHAKSVLEDLLAAPAALGRVKLRGSEDELDRQGLREGRKLGRWSRAGEILSRGASITQYHLFHKLIRQTGLTASIQGLRPHLLRHAAATRLMRDGAPLPVVQWYLNHKDPRTTSRYLHPASRDVEKYLRPV